MVWSPRPLVLCLLLASGCGGGGGGGGPPPPPVFQVEIPQHDFGSIWMDGATPAPNPGLDLAVGDTADPHAGRVVLRFRLDGLPSGAVIQKATLRVPRTKVHGNPSTLGDLLVDHIHWPLNLPSGPELFAQHTLAGAFAVMVPPSFVQIGQPAILTVDVTTQLNADQLAGRNTSGFRLGFSNPTSNNGSTDAWVIGGQMGSGGAVHASTLSVSYRVP